MDRLTMNSDKGGVAFTFDLDITCKPSEAHKILKLAEKLKHYEDLAEQKRLIELPLAIGSRVYSVTRNFISEYTICSIEMYNEGFFFSWKCEKGIYINVCGFTNHEIGKTVFLTKEEAEQALKQIGE